VIRRLVMLGVVLAAAAAAAVLMAAGGTGPNPYRVDALFNNADFLVAGQDVKIAGAVEGQVKAVRLTPQHRARVELEVKRDFGPFRTDASCSIRPEGLIGEKFVDCDPGTPSGGPLKARGGAVPVVPIRRNHSPVDLDLVFAALRMPYRERLTLLVNELGVGLAGRPRELSEAIRQANPALQRANRVLAILDRDRHTLGRLIDASDRVLAELAARRGDVSDFIVRANRVAAAVAGRRGDLGLAIHRLPPMLDQLEPAARDLAALATDARPVARDLRVAAEPLRQLLGDFGPLSDAAGPTLLALHDLSRTGRHAIDATTPVAIQLLPIARRLPAVARLAAVLNASLKNRGVIEGLAAFVYYGSAATARFDRFSHILPSYQIAGTCQQYATTPTPGCSARWGRGGGGDTTPGKRVADRSSELAVGRGRRGRRGSSPRPAPAPSPPATRDRPPATPEAPALPPLPQAPAPPQTQRDVQRLLDYLLHP
jgi:ABC-type transporter Mla subunit MlaD